MHLSVQASKRTLLAAAVTTAIGATAIPQQSSAQILQFSWDGLFIILDSGGNPLANVEVNANGAKISLKKGYKD